MKHETKSGCLSGYGTYTCRASCSCKWEGDLHFGPAAFFLARVDEIRHKNDKNTPMCEVKETLDLIIKEVAELMEKTH